MKLWKIGTAMCAVCLVGFILIAGCASQTGETQSQQTSSQAPQVTVTPASASQGSAANQNTNDFIDDSGNVPSQDQSQVTLAPDTTIVPDSGAAGENLTPDSTDFGDITP